MRRVYLGWENPRKCYVCPQSEVVVLVDASQARFFRGVRARSLRSDLLELQNHICGVKKSASVEHWLPSDDPHRVAAYNKIFTAHWENGA